MRTKMLSTIPPSTFLAALALSSLLVSSRPSPAAEPAGEFSNPRVDFGLVVKDAARTAQFLTNVIGLTEVRGFQVTSELGRKIGLTAGHATPARVFAADDSDRSARFKVLAFPMAPGQQPDQQYIHSTLGVRYLTLFVKDMTAAVERIKKAGVKLEGETPVDLGGGNQLTVVRDPDGNFYELIGPVKK
jgi:lactoylglutathione lyase